MTRTVISAGIQDVYGTAVSTTLIGSRSLQDVERGGLARGTTVRSGGEQLLAGGIARNTRVSSGGAQVIGGTAYDTVVSRGGVVTLAGGNAYGITVLAGGIVDVQSGKASNLAVRSGGALDFANLQYSAADKVTFVEASSHKSGTLAVGVPGTQTKIVLFGQYIAGGFHIGHSRFGNDVQVTYAPKSAHTDLAFGHH